MCVYLLYLLANLPFLVLFIVFVDIGFYMISFFFKLKNFLAFLEYESSRHRFFLFHLQF